MKAGWYIYFFSTGKLKHDDSSKVFKRILGKNTQAKYFMFSQYIPQIWKLWKDIFSMQELKEVCTWEPFLKELVSTLQNPPRPPPHTLAIP